MTSKNYLFNSIKENIRRNFSLLILLSVAMLAVLPAYTLMSLDVAKIQESMQGELISPVQQELLECLGMGNPGLMVVVIFSAVLLGLTGFSLSTFRRENGFLSQPALKERRTVCKFLFQRIFYLPAALSGRFSPHLSDRRRIWRFLRKYHSDSV